MKISVRGEAIGAIYSKPGLLWLGAEIPSEEKLYTGAKVAGYVELRKGSNIIIKLKFNGEVETPESSSSGSSSPKRAPFKAAVKKSNLDYILLKLISCSPTLEKIIIASGKLRENGIVLTPSKYLTSYSVSEEDTSWLINILKSDASSGARIDAANVLGKIGSSKAIEPLIATMLGTHSSELKKYIRISLELLTKQDLGDDEEKWKLWWENETGKKLVEFVAESEKGDIKIRHP